MKGDRKRKSICVDIWYPRTLVVVGYQLHAWWVSRAVCARQQLSSTGKPSSPPQHPALSLPLWPPLLSRRRRWCPWHVELKRGPITLVLWWHVTRCDVWHSAWRADAILAPAPGTWDLLVWPAVTSLLSLMQSTIIQMDRYLVTLICMISMMYCKVDTLVILYVTRVAHCYSISLQYWMTR